MVYTEIKQRNKKKYYYRVLSVRKGNKVSKKRIYLGINLNKGQLIKKEGDANNQLRTLNNPSRLYSLRIKHTTNCMKQGVIQNCQLISEKKYLKNVKEIIAKILRKNKIKKAGIFGSYVRGEQNKSSDIDILIETPREIGLFDFVGIKLELEDLLRKKVDLVEYKLIRPELKKIILNEEVRII